MACDTQLAPAQTLSERKREVRAAIERLSTLLAKRQVKPIIGPQGAIAFEGWQEAERGRISDACAYRLIMSTGSVFARQEIAKQERLQGRSVNRQVIGQGVHSHDGGRTWHDKG